ncbi:hypothetical protein ACVIGB_000823 [Bradyrhizobium sp. USDA 4341]
MSNLSDEETIAIARIANLPISERDLSAPVYLRVGKWNPADPRSRNYAAGDIEIGLSVYELDATINPVMPPEGEWAETDLNERMRGDEPKFLVQGDVLGWGHDGEPLLGNPRVVGAYSPAARPAPSR